MRLLALLACLLLLATFAPAGMHVPPQVPKAGRLVAIPVLLDGDRPGRRSVGALEYLDGWELRSDDPRFGGISALHVTGGEALAISDSGMLVQFTLPQSAGPLAFRMTSLSSGPGAFTSKMARDAEALTISGGTAWIGFESARAIWRYRLPAWNEGKGSAPQAMRGWPMNGGSEAMLRLPDGRFLVFAEHADGGVSDVLLFDGDPAIAGTPMTRLSQRPLPGYRITDAALLPDGRMLLLHRRLSLLNGFTASLSVAPGGSWRGGVIEGRELARFAPPVTADNFEALSVTREGGRTILWIASDDNFSPMQRSLLLKFALVE